MYFKRNGPFRFEFDQPITGTLKKLHELDIVTIYVLLLGISIQGAKIICKKDIYLEKGADISLTFTLNNLQFYALGTINWTKLYNNSIEVGLQLNTDDSYQRNLVTSLKDIVKTILSN